MKYLHQLGCAASLLIALILPVSAAANPNESTDEIGIRQIMMSTWDTPQTRLEVGPVVIKDKWAVAGWIQGQRGGRALLTRNVHGQWQVSVCGGDGLKEANTLVMTGMPFDAAQDLAQQVEKAEAAIPAERLALFATFEGMLRMEGMHSHPPQTAPNVHRH
ncbi:hypothetical protein AXE65_01740 [Ventosimonas gracilis]|uniref:Copper uptake system-associated protein n=1 Tax=Ventosimonas gracilis TaxID=1680762 RepID=A0A139SUP6_9GAMM|nr:copper uptake system-associated protein [Ventosimonas gracilis]KXU38313.1 hypothetical protein AXE65_01740 [Ventosimonas gracilis]